MHSQRYGSSTRFRRYDTFQRKCKTVAGRASALAASWTEYSANEKFSRPPIVSLDPSAARTDSPIDRISCPVVACETPITVSIRASFLTRIYGTFPGTDLDDGEFQTNSSSRSRGSSSNLTLIRLRQTHQSTPTLKNQRNDKSKARAGLGGVVAARAPRHFAPRAHEPRTAHAHRPVRETDEVQDSISDSPQRSRVSRGLSSLRRFATISRESRWRKTETATRTFELSIVLKGPTAPCPRSLSKSTTQLFQIEILLPRTPTPTTRPPQCTSRARCTRQDTRLRALSLSLVVFFLSLFEMRAEENTTDDDEKRSSNSRACQERDSLPARALSLSLSLSLSRRNALRCAHVGSTIIVIKRECLRSKAEAPSPTHTQRSRARVCFTQSYRSPLPRTASFFARRTHLS